VDKKIAAIIVALVLGVVAITISVVALVQKTTVVVASGHVVSLRSGIYADGAPGTPHYFVSLEVSPNGSITGDVDYLYQDGKTDVALTFLGTGQDNIANLHVGYVNASNATSEGPTSITMTWGPNSILMGDCGFFLRRDYPNRPGCYFHYSANGLR